MPQGKGKIVPVTFPNRPLPISGEVHGRLIREREPGEPAELFAIGQTPILLPPGRLLCLAEQVPPGDVAVMANFRAAHPREKFLCPIGASAVQRIGFRVVNALHFITRMQRVPVCRVVSVDDGPLAIRALTNESACPSVRNTAGTLLQLRSRTMTTARRLPDWFSRNRRSLRFSLRLAGFDVATEAAGIDLRDLAFPADNSALQFSRHGLEIGRASCRERV